MKKLYDLTHVIDPAKANRKFAVKMIGADEVNPNVVRLKNKWYIMHEINMVNHIATHIETPYHLFKEGEDLGKIPADRYCGAGILISLKSVPPKSPITREAVIKAGEDAGGIKEGDIAFFNLGYSDKYGTGEYGNSPYFSNEAIRWIVDRKIKMMGVDAGGVEIPGSEEHVNHGALFSGGVLLIENLANLDSLPVNRFTVYAFPIPIKGMDSFPLRVIAETEE
jgi:kynurenine formamidase